MFFSSWSSLLRVAAVGIPAYVALIAVLRLSGKRTLSKFNAFDLIVTVAFGSTLSAGLVSPGLALADVVAAFALLVLLQFLITWGSTRSTLVDRIVKSEPTLLYRGGFLPSAMMKERVTEGEVLAAVRARGAQGLDEVEAVVLETDGTISVVSRGSAPPTVLRDVRGWGA